MEIFDSSSPGKGYTHRPALWVCLCFIFGIILSPYIKIPFFILFGGAVVLLFLGWFMSRQKKISVVLLLMTFGVIGSMYRQNYETFPSDHISQIAYGYRKEPVAVEGLVVSDVEPRKFFKGRKTVFTLKVKRIKTKWGWKEKSGPVLVNLFRDEDIQYGDYLLIEGKLHRPFNFSEGGLFSYRDYLYRRGITYILSVKKSGRTELLRRNQGHWIGEWSFRFKHRLIKIIRTYLFKHEAGIMQAFLLGDRYDIPKYFYDLCKLSGVAHIIAISGFNVGIVAYMIFLILKMFPIPRQAQYILTMAFLVFYAFLTGGQPPVVRATIMAVVFLASFLVERDQESINTLSLAALILLLMNPLNLFDAGFQLSFISVLAIILFYPRLMQVFYKIFPAFREGQGKNTFKHKAVRYLLQSTAFSLVAYLGVFPLVVYYFQFVTPVVVLANLVIVPISSLLIYFGMGLLITGIICPVIAFTFASCITVLLNLMVAMVVFFTWIPGAYFEWKAFPLWAVFLYYGLTGLAWSVFHLGRKT